MKTKVLNLDNKAQTGNWGMEGSVNFGSSSSMPNDTGNGGITGNATV